MLLYNLSIGTTLIRKPLLVLPSMLYVAPFFSISGLIRRILIGCAFAVLIGLPSISTAEIKVLTSIKPLGLIAKEIAGEAAEVDILLPVNASPHDYPMKISDMRRIRQADLILWVGPTLETFLVSAFKSVAPTQLITAAELKGIYWPEPDTGKSNSHFHDHDPHIWLDPRNAVVIANVLALKLSEMDQENADLYQSNAARFTKNIRSLDIQIGLQLEPVKTKGFAVYHEGYLHFVEHYDLKQLAYVTFTPEQRPGAKHLYMLRKELKNHASCLFTEPYYDTSVAAGLAQELGLKIATLNPLGAADVNSYYQLMDNMTADFLACLTQ